MTNFEIRSITIDRGYGQKEPFRARVSVSNSFNADMTIKVDEERTLQIIDIINDLLVDGLTSQIADMRSDAVVRLEAFREEQAAKALEDHSAIDDAEIDEDVPF